MDSLYPLALGPHGIGFEKTTITRALRLRIIKGAKSGHPHLTDKVASILVTCDQLLRNPLEFLDQSLRAIHPIPLLVETR